MTEKRKAILQFKEHHYIQEFCYCDFFCPYCGNKGLWSDTDGDYYIGSQYYCTECFSSCPLDHASNELDEPYRCMVKQLKENKIIEITKKGALND